MAKKIDAKAGAKARAQAVTKAAAKSGAGSRAALLQTLQARFERHPQRHPSIAWADVLARLEGNDAALRALQAMEDSGGEPDLIAVDDADGGFVFADCAEESPTGRRSTCYDAQARTSRKEHAPAASAEEQAVAMGVELMSEAQYRRLQELGEFDRKTSSWIATPADLRELGGALFCDRRYGRVFVYHNGAQSYYAARGFRGVLRV
jgi:hypothetical protein